MSIALRFAVLSMVAAVAASCTTKAEREKEEAVELSARLKRLDTRLAKVDTHHAKPGTPVALWIMPPELREISGLALLPNGMILTHDDEVGKVYEIDPRRGEIIKSFTLGDGPRKDFEAIAVAGDDRFLLSSKGVLYRFRDGPDQSRVPYTMIDTHLGDECEFESAVYEPDSAWLVMPCKTVYDQKLRGNLVVFRLKLSAGRPVSVSSIVVPLSEAIGSNKWKSFRPSDITIDPQTGNYVMVSGIQGGILEMTPAGEVLDSRPLPGNHAQAEGVAITRDSVLIISDEATSKPATITLYRWRPKSSGGIQS